MGIRFTETEKWADKLFRKWKPETKLLFLFIVAARKTTGT